MNNRERLTELRYQMEKNSFILSIIEARISIIWHAEEMGYSITDTAIITRTSTHYVSFVIVLFFKLFTASCCTLFTTISKIIPNATSHYSSPIMHIKYCYPKTKHII